MMWKLEQVTSHLIEVEVVKGLTKMMVVEIEKTEELVAVVMLEQPFYACQAMFVVKLKLDNHPSVIIWF